MTKNLSTDRRKPKQPAIIHAAAELFAQHGYDGTSTEMIAERAGVSRQTIYNQFASKEALFLAIAATLVCEAVAPLAEAVERADDLRETLIAFGRRILGVLLCPRTTALRRLVLTELPRFPDLGRAVYEAGPARAESELAAYLRSQRRLCVTDEDMAARQFLGLVTHPVEFKAMLGIIADADSPEVAEHISAAVDTFLRAYGGTGD